MAQIVRRIVYSAAAPITISGYTIGLDYNTTNLQVNGGALDTIQDIHTGATPTFAGLNFGAEATISTTIGDINLSPATNTVNLASTFTFDLPTGADRTVNFGNNSIDDSKETSYIFYGCQSSGYAGNRHIAFRLFGNAIWITSDASILVVGRGIDESLVLGYGGGHGAPHIKISPYLTAGQNPYIEHYGYISAASAKRYYRVKLDDTNDEVRWYTQDSYVTGFCFKLPDNAGGTEWRVRDSDGVVVASINSDGGAYFAGNVGVGTDSPDAGLHLKDTGQTNGTEMVFEETAPDKRPAFFMKNDTGNRAGFFYYGSDRPYYAGDLRIYMDDPTKDIHFSNMRGVGINVGDYDLSGKFQVNYGTSRVCIDANGVMDFGVDTNLYRSAADTLKTDDKFIASSAQFGTATDYLAIAEDGELTLVGDSRVRGFMRLDPKRFKIPAANYPGETFEGIFYTLDFDDSTEESAYAEVEIPCDWDNTTDISVSVYWFHDNADNGAVKWGLEYRAIKCGEAISDTTTTITATSAGNHAAGELVCTTFTTGISAADLERGDELAIRLYRDADDAADTLGEDARVIAVQFCYTKNRLGEPVV